MISSIRTTCMGFQKPHEQETTGSYVFRAVVLVAGASLIGAGLFIHFKPIPQLAAGSYYWIGTGVALTACFCIKRVKTDPMKNRPVDNRPSFPVEDLEKFSIGEFNTAIRASNPDYLRQFPERFLNDENLDLSHLEAAELKILFSGPVMTRRKTLEKMHIQALNKILSKLDDMTLGSIPEKHLLDPEFAWESVSRPVSLFTRGMHGVNHGEFVDKLDVETLNGLIKIWPWNAVVYLVQHLSDLKKIRWEDLSDQTILEIEVPAKHALNYNDVSSGIKKIFENLDIHTVNRLLSRMSDQLFELLPQEHLDHSEFKFQNLPAAKQSIFYSKERLLKLPTQDINSLLPKLELELINQIWKELLEDSERRSELDLNCLTDEQFNKFFPIQNGYDKVETFNKFEKLTEKQLINIAHRLNGRHLCQVPDGLLNNPSFREKVSDKEGLKFATDLRFGNGDDL